MSRGWRRPGWARFGRAEQGQVLILVAILTPILLAMVAVVTDTSMIWLSRRGLQNATDAAALAGVQELPEDTALARSVACDYATVRNAVDDMTLDCAGADITISTTYVTNDTIKVTAHRTVNSLLGVFGMPTTEVHASATAVIGSIVSYCPFPIFQTPEMLPDNGTGSLAFYTLTAMHLAGADNAKGNFLTVDVGAGANAVLDAMINNTCGSPIGPDAATETGGKIGKVVDGFEWRIYCSGGGGTLPGGTSCAAGFPGASTCTSGDINEYMIDGTLDPDVTRENCPRLVVIPIFPGPVDGYTGKTTVTIDGFALFYISGVCSTAKCSHPSLGELQMGDAWGYYVERLTSEQDVTAYNEYGIKVPVLVD